MEFIKAEKTDLKSIANFYIYAIENTEKMDVYTHWEYGFYPDNELVLSYINKGEMYMLKNGEKIVAAGAVSLSQPDNYTGLNWQKSFGQNEVAVLHLFCVSPDAFNSGNGKLFLQKAEEVAIKNRKKALRLDTFKVNIPAQNLYKKCGFVCCGDAGWSVPNLENASFYVYEKLL